MEKEKSKSGLVALLLIIILALITLIILAATDRINLKNIISDGEKTDTCDCTSHVSECPSDNMDSIDYQELAKISKMDYNFVKGEYSNDYSVNILSDGKVLVNFNNYISNISNAKDLILFSGPGGDDLVYILATDGNLYKYNLANVNSKNFEATKLDEYTNIKQMVRYKTRKANAGGCDYVIVIDNDGKYQSIDSYCV